MAAEAKRMVVKTFGKVGVDEVENWGYKRDLWHYLFLSETAPQPCDKEWVIMTCIPSTVPC